MRAVWPEVRLSAKRAAARSRKLQGVYNAVPGAPPMSGMSESVDIKSSQKNMLQF